MYGIDIFDPPHTLSRRPPTGRIAHVGPAGSHGERALRLHLGLSPGQPLPPGTALPCRDISDTIRALRDGEVDQALIPWRNALGGSIHESLDGVLEHEMRIESAVTVPVRHCLAVRRDLPLHEINVVRSHPEALRQCRKLLRRLSSARREPASSTSAAAAALATAAADEADGIAVLCAPEAAERYGLTILVEDATDHPDNATMFVLLVREGGARDRATEITHTAIVLTVAHRRGALARGLTTLAAAGVQLTHLESRPLVGRPWEVQFVIEAEGSPECGKLATGLAEVRGVCTHVRVLGSWNANIASRSEQAPATEPPVDDVVDASAVEVSTVEHEGSEPGEQPEVPARLVDLGGGRAATLVTVGDVEIGGDGFVLIGGPCSVESREQVMAVAAAVRSAGGRILRGGAFKPRTSPYAFQGLGEQGLALLAEAGRVHGLPVVTEVLQPELVGLCAEYADMLQIGARNMQNFPLLAEVGRCHRPVLLKRGMSASIDELLFAAEYILARGNTQVVLCERGIRTFETATRSTLDVSAVPVLRERTHLPVIVDPSHAAGVRRYVPPLSRAARAVGAHGLIVEIHPDPASALSDGPQALTLPMWRDLARELLAS